MRIASTAELKNRTNELVRTALAGEPVIITIYGRPAVALEPLSRQRIAEFLVDQHGQEMSEPARPWTYTSVQASVGTVYVAYTDRGVVNVDLASTDRAYELAVQQRFGRVATRDPDPPQALIRQLRATLSSGKEFSGPVDLSMVGPFERHVLDELRQIPRGQVRTYREIATRIGHPTATRAVGNACAKNPVPLLIPCHRVVRSDGGLGGYSLKGGVPLKRRLLQLEEAGL